MLNQLIEICHNEFGINNIIDNNNRLISSDDIPRLIAIVTTQRRIIRADCDNFEYIIEVYRHDEDMTTISIDGTVFTKLNASWLVNTFGAKIIGQDSELILTILKDSVEQAEEKTYYDFIGWGTVSGKLCFVANGFKVDSAGINKVNTTNRKPDQADLVTEKDACEFICDRYLSIFKNKNVGMTFLCFSVLANLQVPVKQNGEYINFLMYIYGESGTGKTSTAFPMLNPFNLPSASVTDTEAATLNIVNGNNCSVTILDDVKSSRSKRCIQTLETLVRIAGDEFTVNGRKIGRTVETVQLNNLIAATGEIKPPLQPSSIARMIILEFDKKTVNVEKLKRIQADLDNFKQQMICFLLHFIQHALSRGWIEEFTKKVSKREGQLLQNIRFKHGRYYRMLAWLECIGESVIEFIRQRGVSLDCGKDFQNFIQNLLIKQDRIYSPESPLTMYLRTMNRMIEIGALKCVSMSQSHESDDFDIIEHEGKYYIRSFKVYDTIAKHLSDNGYNLPTIEKAMRQLMKQHNLICKSGKYLTLERKVGKNNKSVSFTCVYKNKIDITLEKEENYNEK